MTKKSITVMILFLLALCLAACGPTVQPTEPATLPTEPEVTETAPPVTEPTAPAPTEPPTEEPTVAETTPPHSELYIPGLDVEEVIRYFNEVCLDAEFINGGDATLLQKWVVPIRYVVHGEPTEEDLSLLADYTAWLNTIEGFPGIEETKDPTTANLRLYFCSQQRMLELMGDHLTGLDGAVTFWYIDDEIYDAIICVRTDLNQYLRNSVLQEEIYNGLGPIQDTDLREDSIIYSGYSEPQSLTEIDELILKLLYHPDIQCSMNAEECAAVIRQLYY